MIWDSKEGGIIIRRFKNCSKNLEYDLYELFKNDNWRDPIKVRDFTPDILVKFGVENLPMYENPSHIKRNILTEMEAKILGLRIGPKINYHGLGIEGYMKVIDELDDPRAIFKHNIRNDYLIITMQKDQYGNTVIVPIEVNATSMCNKNRIKINRIKTMFGFKKEFKNLDLHDYIKKSLSLNNFTKIYTKKRTRCRV